MGNQQQILQQQILLEGLNISLLDKFPKSKFTLDQIKERVLVLHQYTLEEHACALDCKSTTVSKLAKLVYIQFESLPLPKGFSSVRINTRIPYAVNREGVVISVKTRRILSTSVTSKGYVACPILKWNSTGKPTKNYLLHRIVALTFLNNPDNLPQVNHINGNKLDNTLTNLEWCDNEYNMEHSITTGLRPKENFARGSKQGHSILTEEQVTFIKERFLSKKGTKLDFDKSEAQSHGVSTSCISLITSNINWKHI